MKVERVNYQRQSDRKALVSLLNAYAMDPLGGGTALSDEVQQRLCDELSRVPGACSFIVWSESQQDPRALGLINAFLGFSTFAAKPLMNIHDVFVTPDARGTGVLQLLFEAVEQHARSLGCCKITLEVLDANHRARAAYRRQGFKGYDLGEEGGEALFWQKKLV